MSFNSRNQVQRGRKRDLFFKCVVSASLPAGTESLCIFNNENLNTAAQFLSASGGDLPSYSDRRSMRHRSLTAIEEADDQIPKQKKKKGIIRSLFSGLLPVRDNKKKSAFIPSSEMPIQTARNLFMSLSLEDRIPVASCGTRLAQIKEYRTSHEVEDWEDHWLSFQEMSCAAVITNKLGGKVSRRNKDESISGLLKLFNNRSNVSEFTSWLDKGRIRILDLDLKRLEEFRNAMPCRSKLEAEFAAELAAELASEVEPEQAAKLAAKLAGELVPSLRDDENLRLVLLWYGAKLVLDVERNGDMDEAINEVQSLLSHAVATVTTANFYESTGPVGIEDRKSILADVLSAVILQTGSGLSSFQNQIVEPIRNLFTYLDLYVCFGEESITSRSFFWTEKLMLKMARSFSLGQIKDYAIVHSSTGDVQRGI